MVSAIPPDLVKTSSFWEVARIVVLRARGGPILVDLIWRRHSNKSEPRQTFACRGRGICRENYCRALGCAAGDSRGCNEVRSEPAARGLVGGKLQHWKGRALFCRCMAPTRLGRSLPRFRVWQSKLAPNCLS